MADQDVMIQTLVELADTLVDDFDVVDLLTLLTDRCVEVFEVTDAGLMLAAPVGAELQVMASSSATMRRLELYELQTSDGPCLAAYRSGEPVLESVLETSVDRWPRFAPVAIEAGFRSVAAIPMRLRGTTIGALNLFHTEPGSLGDQTLTAAQAFADVATIALLQHQASLDARTINDQLNHALTSRVIIEQAKGMLAERAGIEVDEAFERLRDHARRHNVRLATVAQDLLHGSLDAAALRPKDAPST